jgi:acetyl esterase/lipase
MRAVISVNELDPLRSEGVEYFRRLRRCRVRARARVLPGTSHAADCPGIEVLVVLPRHGRVHDTGHFGLRPLGASAANGTMKGV